MPNPRFARFDSGAASGGPTGPESFGPEPTASTPPASGSGFSLGMVYYTLFRHKKKILLCAGVGLAAAVGFYLTNPPPFVSRAAILVKFVETSPERLVDDGSSVQKPDSRGDTIVRTEAEIIRSYDLAREVARIMGPERIRPDLGTAATEEAAAALVSGGLDIATARSSAVISLTFTAHNPDNLQAILDQILQTYQKRHFETHRSGGVRQDALTQETDQLRAKLGETEQELQHALERAGVISLAEAKHVFGTQISGLEQAIMTGEAELAGARAALAAVTGTRTQAPDEAATTEGSSLPTPPPPEVITVYRQVTTQLTQLYRREQDLMAQFTAETPMVKGVRAQIEENENTKARLEREHPGLIAATAAATAASAGASMGDRKLTGYDPAAEIARIRSIESTIAVMRTQLTTVRNEVAALGAVETQIAGLERRRELLAKQYNYFAENLEKKRIDLALGSVSGITIIQTPSPPMRDSRPLIKKVAGIAFGGLALGLALAFAIELFLDPTVRRPAEVESSLNLPLVLTIPKLKRRQTAKLAAANARLLGAGERNQGAGVRGQESEAGGQSSVVGSPSSSASALTPWSADHALREYFDALRDRLIHSFEMRGITRKPKLVAVTSCSPDTGVSTVAAGLAASLSETGDGNVLLVDMHPNRKSPQFFHKGDLKIGLDDVLAEETRDDAMVRENLYMISQQTAEDRLSWIMPKRFAQLVPKMKASDFDYIIFDMPPVSQISATPQLARYMDQVLMVVESEKTNRDAVKRAGTMLAEAGANVGVVLNKTRTYVPRALDHDALAS